VFCGEPEVHPDRVQGSLSQYALGRHGPVQADSAGGLPIVSDLHEQIQALIKRARSRIVYFSLMPCLLFDALSHLADAV
jgi:hypothetical protein